MDELLRQFGCDHLPKQLQGVGKDFAHLAEKLARELPNNGARLDAVTALHDAMHVAFRAFLVPPADGVNK